MTVAPSHHYYSWTFVLYFCLASRRKTSQKIKVYNFADQISMPPLPFHRPNGFSAGWTAPASGWLFRCLNDYFESWLLVFCRKWLWQPLGECHQNLTQLNIHSHVEKLSKNGPKSLMTTYQHQQSLMSTYDECKEKLVTMYEPETNKTA